MHAGSTSTPICASPKEPRRDRGQFPPASARQPLHRRRRGDGLYVDAHRLFDLREGNRGLLGAADDAGGQDLRLAQDLRRDLVHRAGLWPGHRHVRRLSRRRHLSHQRSVQRLRGHPYPGHARLEAGVPRRPPGLLRRQPHPQYRHGRRRAGVAVAHPDRSPPGGPAHPADAAGARRRHRRESAAHHGSQCAHAGAEPRRPQRPDRRASMSASARCTRSSTGSAWTNSCRAPRPSSITPSNRPAP
ncbi:Uncharacterised protein [Bordetella pertussis]|nr:Uncharacterised protein [Bordetella pertussis]